MLALHVVAAKSVTVLILHSHVICMQCSKKKLNDEEKVRRYILEDVHKHIYARCTLDMLCSGINTEANFHVGRKPRKVEGKQTVVHPCLRTPNHSCVILPNKTDTSLYNYFKEISHLKIARD
jgi:hypothetical protein